MFVETGIGVGVAVGGAELLFEPRPQGEGIDALGGEKKEKREEPERSPWNHRRKEASIHSKIVPRFFN